MYICVVSGCVLHKIDLCLLPHLYKSVKVDRAFYFFIHFLRINLNTFVKKICIAEGFISTPLLF